MLKTDKVLTFLPSAEAIRQHSKDDRTKVGAIILDPEYAIVASGWNGFPRNVNDTRLVRYEPPLKYLWNVHAEVNAIANAARRGVSLNGCEMLIVGAVICAQCCATAIQAGIKGIHNPAYDKNNPSHIRLTDSYIQACEMMHEAMLKHTEY